MKSILTASVIFLAGCSTIPIPAPVETGPKIIVTRDKGFSGSGCMMTVLVDGWSIGVLKAGTSISKDVKPGKHSVRVGMGQYSDGNFLSTTLCSNLTMSKAVVVEDSPKIFRLGMGGHGGQLFFDEVE